MARRIQLRFGGYGPATTCFSLALKRIGDRLEARYGDEIEVRYVWNIMDLSYRSEDILWLVESGVLSLGYQSSSYLSDRVAALGIVDLPFVFRDKAHARAAFDGALGRQLADAIEATCNYRILGWLENGFRHISNCRRPVRTPADLAGMTIRALPSDIHVATFEALGAVPLKWDLTEALAAIVAGKIDAQENPLANTVTYGAHAHHPFHTLTGHFYISRPVFAHRPTFDALPGPVQAEMRAAVADAVIYQRALAEQEEIDAAAAIRAAGGTLLELTPDEQQQFRDAVQSFKSRALAGYDATLVSLVA
jgi:TRAP-type C4-dicarboxylate transport system substrate-binding protein